MNRHFILFAIVFAAALSGFAKTFDVDISAGRPAASNEAYYHGETIEFRAVRGRSVVTNVEYSCVYYQTNGMDSVWWHTDGLVFHPTNDVGAASYRFFLEGRDDLGRDWHANGLLRLLPSPGFTPNTIELPVATLDFAAVDVLNPPWTDPDYSTNNTELVETIEATAPAPGNYAAVSNAAINALSRAEAGLSAWSLTPTPQSPWSIQFEAENGIHADGWFLVIDSQRVDFYEEEETATTIPFTDYTATRTLLPTKADIPTAQINAATATNALQDAELESLSDSISALSNTKASKSDATLTERGFTEWSIAHTPLSAEAKSMFYDESDTAAVNDYAVTIRDNDLYVGDYFVASLSLSSDGLRYAFLAGSGTAYIVWGPPGTTVATRELLSGYVLGSQIDKPLASEAEAAANRSAIATLTANVYTKAETDAAIAAATPEETDPTVPSWAKAAAKPTYTASEVGAATAEDVYRIVAGTNVLLIVTNYNSAVHAPLMSLQHLDPDTGEYVVYWNELRRHGITLTNAMEHADAAVAAERERADAAYAPRAWSHTTSGLGAEAPAGVTWISTPETVIAGGYEYEKVVTSAGAVWVLASNGLTAGATTNGYFRIEASDGTELFSIEKTDSYLVGVPADGITRSGNTVTIPLNVVAPSHPYIRAATNLVNAVWTKEDENGFACDFASVSWSGSSGAYVATVTCAEPQAFFYFEFLHEGSSKIRNSAATEMTGGIYFNGTTYMPTVNGNKLEFVAQ